MQPSRQRAFIHCVHRHITYSNVIHNLNRDHTEFLFRIIFPSQHSRFSELKKLLFVAYFISDHPLSSVTGNLSNSFVRISPQSKSELSLLLLVLDLSEMQPMGHSLTAHTRNFILIYAGEPVFNNLTVF